MTIQIFAIVDNCEHEILYQSSIFPGGEIHIRLNDDGIFGGDIQDAEDMIAIYAGLKNANDIMTLLLVTDVIKMRWKNIPIVLTMPYCPYARQDRAANFGESLSLKVFCDLINSQHYTAVTVYDPHSDVATALLNNCLVVPQHELLVKAVDFSCYEKNSKIYLVAPDAGALKKSEKALSFLNEQGLELQFGLLLATKHRDTKTGEIVGTKLHDVPSDMELAHTLIIDDICDGGRTFIELNRIIVEHKPLSTSLYVTHGIFSKGMDFVKEGGSFSNIFATFNWTTGDFK